MAPSISKAMGGEPMFALGKNLLSKQIRKN